MDRNICIFNGTVEWYKEKQIGPGWGLINCRVGLPNFELKDSLGVMQKVTKPIVWLNVKTTYSQDGIIQPSNILTNFEEKRFVVISDAKISHYDTEAKDKDGIVIKGAPRQTRFSLECNAYNITFSHQPYQEINACSFKGRVIDYNETTDIMTVSCSYRTKTEVKHKLVPVYTQKKYTPILKGAPVIVTGSVCGKTLSRESILYIAADTIINIK